MPRKISLYTLLGTVVLIGILFYQVIQPFIFSLLFAAVLAVMFGPLNRKLTRRLGSHRRLAALITTIGILTLIILPLGGALVVAGIQLFDLSKDVVEMMRSPEESELSEEIQRLQETRFAKGVARLYGELTPDNQARFKDLALQGANGVAKHGYEKTVGLVGDVVTFLIRIVVTGLAVYYFLADGDSLLQQFKQLSPMEDAEEDALIEQFGRVCRGVVAGTVVAALAQAILAGIGFLVAGVPNALLLVAVTMFCAFIPFVGAGTVVTVVSLWLAVEQEYLRAILLFAYGAAVVATADNLIRAYVIGNEVRMNPLVALITVVGALQLIGLWGIFVGPMVAALFYTLLQLLRERIVKEQQVEAEEKRGES